MEQKFAQKAKQLFGEVCIDKSLCSKAGLVERSIPTFVGEWLIDRYCPNGQLTKESLSEIRRFVQEHLPTKDQKEEIKNRLSNGETLILLDHFNVIIDLRTNTKRLMIPCIDEKGFIESSVLEKFPFLLRGGIWGAGRLIYLSPDVSEKKLGEIWLTDFKPMQIATLDLDFYCEQRSQFSLDEWRALLVNSMGNNPEAYSPEQQLFLLARLIPIVQPRVNIIELAPKGTGKSFTYSNLSRYVRMISGGKVTAAVLFYNLVTNQPGLLTLYDDVVFDEAQTISFDNPGEVVGVLKDYLESGRYTRGRQVATADAGLVFLGNIPIDSSGKPNKPVLFRNLPDFLQETAFIDRLHGIITGWDLPRITVNSPAQGIGFKADFCSEVLHQLRNKTRYIEYFRRHVKITGTDDMRDKKAIERLGTGFLKLLFPDLRLSLEELYQYSALPAVRLRQHVRDQLAKMDPEYKIVSIGAEVV